VNVYVVYYYDGYECGPPCRAFASQKEAEDWIIATLVENEYTWEAFFIETTISES
jgi:hypothetical protein